MEAWPGVRIGTVARLADVSIQTILFYERQGLIPVPHRNGSNYRVYSPQIVDLVRFIKCAQQLSFTLQEIKNLILLRNSGAASCADVKEFTSAKIEELEKKASEIRSSVSVLARLAAQCSETAVAGECPIIKFLDTKAGE